MPIALGFAYADTCDVERYKFDETNFNNRKRVPLPHLSNIPCRFKQNTETAVNSITTQFERAISYTLLIDNDTDIITGDRIKNVRLDGENLLTDNFEVTGVSIGRGRLMAHKTLNLSRMV